MRASALFLCASPRMEKDPGGSVCGQGRKEILYPAEKIQKFPCFVRKY